MERIIILMVLFLANGALDAKTYRDQAQRAAFMRLNPCPSTGLRRGKCPGYVVDHREALACGGADAPYNMQWQTKQAASDKDKWERKGCQK